MSWKACKKYIIWQPLDLSKVSSILEMCKVREETIKTYDSNNVFLIVEIYYEIIKELLIALLLFEEKKSKNHECLVSFFEKYFEDNMYETKILHELKNIRNAIQYDAKLPKNSYLERNELEFKHIVDLIKKEIIRKLDYPCQKF